jgi:hypothetical protein
MPTLLILYVPLNRQDISLYLLQQIPTDQCILTLSAHAFLPKLLPGSVGVPDLFFYLLLP